MITGTKYNVLIIGAGNIGAFFDTPKSDKFLTHAHAFTKHKGYNLLGFVDVNRQKAQEAASVWRGKAFLSIEEALNKEQIDIACVAVPDDYHYAVLKELSKFPLQVIFSEKPLTKTLGEATDIIQIIKTKNIRVLVNYSRRFVPEFEKIKNDIDKGIYGEYLTGNGYYGKGLMHNGSHLVDLLRYLIGEICSVIPVDSICDFYPDDKSISAILTFENGKPFFIQYVDSRKYTIFEIDLLFERKRIRIHDSGFKIEEYNIKESATFKGYRNVVKSEEINTSLPNALYNVAENIFRHLTDGQSLKCSIEEGYKTLQTCTTIKGSLG